MEAKGERGERWGEPVVTACVCVADTSGVAGRPAGPVSLSYITGRPSRDRFRYPIYRRTSSSSPQATKYYWYPGEYISLSYIYIYISITVRGVHGYGKTFTRAIAMRRGQWA